MALPLLATLPDLEAAMQSPAPLNEASAMLALRRASARVRAYTGQTLSFVSGETVDLSGGERVLALPQRPLVVDDSNALTVVELQVFGTTEVPLTEGADFSRLGNELTRGQPWYQPTRFMGWPWQARLGVWAPKVRVTYSHGYEEIPDDVVDVVLDLAATNLTNPHGLRSLTVGGESATYAVETVGNAKLTREHRADLRRYRRPAFTVVPS